MIFRPAAYVSLATSLETTRLETSSFGLPPLFRCYRGRYGAGWQWALQPGTQALLTAAFSMARSRAGASMAKRSSSSLAQTRTFRHKRATALAAPVGLKPAAT